MTKPTRSRVGHISRRKIETSGSGPGSDICLVVSVGTIMLLRESGGSLQGRDDNLSPTLTIEVLNLGASLWKILLARR